MDWPSTPCSLRLSLYVFSCSAGVGRSGTFIALDITLDQMNAEQKVDVKGTMQKMREKRMYMIQTVVRMWATTILKVVPCSPGHF